MLKGKITLLFMAIITVYISAMAQSSCRYCNGTGQVEKNISVSQYGLQDYKVKCPICGKVTWKSTGHTHISCPKCGGSGVRSSSYSNGRVSDDTSYNPESPEGMAARGLVYDMKYGLPHSEEENVAVERL